MGSSELSDEELLELAKQDTLFEDDDLEKVDVMYYQAKFNIKDGNYKVYLEHIYYSYKKWSSSPTSIETFSSFLNLKRKNNIFCYIDKQSCKLNILKLIGAYVKEKRANQKEKRFRQVPSFKPKT